MDTSDITDIPDGPASDWLTDDQLDGFVALSRDEATDPVAAGALDALLTEVAYLRAQVVIAARAFDAMAGTFDAIVEIGLKVGDEKLLVLLEKVMQANGLLGDDEELFERSKLIVPNREMRRAVVKHQGRTTKVVEL
jgi:hypothetical protein